VPCKRARNEFLSLTLLSPHAGEGS
jgi:hypothetical protein